MIVASGRFYLPPRERRTVTGPGFESRSSPSGLKHSFTILFCDDTLPNVPVRCLFLDFCVFAVFVCPLSFSGFSEVKRTPGRCQISPVPIIKPHLKTTQHSKGFSPGPNTLLLSRGGDKKLFETIILPLDY